MGMLYIGNTGHYAVVYQNPGMLTFFCPNSELLTGFPQAALSRFSGNITADVVFDPEGVKTFANPQPLVNVTGRIVVIPFTISVWIYANNAEYEGALAVVRSLVTHLCSPQLTSISAYSGLRRRKLFWRLRVRTIALKSDANDPNHVYRNNLLRRVGNVALRG